MRFLICLVACTFCLRTVAAEPPPSIRSGWVGVDLRSRHDFSMLDGMASHGMNTVLLAPENHTPEQLLETFAQWQAQTEVRDLHLFCGVFLWNQGDIDRFPLARFHVDAEGREMRRTPCPTDEAFWQRKITDLYVQIARWSRQHRNVAGILLDAELYGADLGGYRGACFCPHCRREVAELLRVDPAALRLDHADAQQRYGRALEKIIVRSRTATRTAVHAANNRLILAGYDVDGRAAPFYRGLLRAWGTEQRPFLICSAGTYQTGYTTSLQEDRIRKWREAGMHFEWLGGLWTKRIPVENVAENLYYYGQEHARLLALPHAILQPPPAAHLPGRGMPAYWKAIETAHRELDQWHASGEHHVSALKIRPFQIAPPGVDLTRARDIPMPRGAAATTELPGFLVRRAEQLFHVVADAGDTVTLTLHFDSAHPSKKKNDAVAIVLVDPKGRIIHDGTFRRSDFSDERSDEGRFTATRNLVFRTETAGTYSLFMKSAYYAFNIRAASHPWIASMHYPGSKSYTRVDYPHFLFLKTQAGWRRASIQVSCSPLTRPATIRILDDEGRTLAEGPIQGNPTSKQRGGLALQFTPRDTDSQIVQMTFNAHRPMRDTNLYPSAGFTPWIGATDTAPFPEP